jgi:hypothetical protein
MQPIIGPQSPTTLVALPFSSLSPATLVAIAIALAALTIAFVTVAIAHSPLPSLLPATTVAVAITLFVTIGIYHLPSLLLLSSPFYPCPLCHQPPSSPLPLPLPPLLLPSLSPATLVTIAIPHVVAVDI